MARAGNAGGMIRGAHASALQREMDAAGGLSIVVQGGLTAANLAQTAVNCGHWRALFPTAEIVLAASVSDVLAGAEPDGRLDCLRLASCHAEDGSLAAALRALREVCDRVVVSEGALPLPPFKDDSGANNFNLQRAAARAGLAVVSGRHVLRIRADAVFLSRDFVDQHAADSLQPRGSAQVLDSRVMISWLFTLNPFTVERLPLHYSDWFHFGGLEDVRRLWAGPPMSLADALHHRVYPHSPNANRRERQFQCRIGIEQHLNFTAFSPARPDLRLDTLTDDRSVNLALDLLVDNFTLCDLARSRFVLPKYQRDLSQPERRLHCLTREDWLALASRHGDDPRRVLASKIEAARAEAHHFGL